MKKIFQLLVCLCSVQQMYAQVNLNIGSGAHFVVSGGANVVMDSGSFINNGSYYDDGGVLKAVGGVAFGGSGVTHLNQLVFNNTQNSQVNSLVSVYDFINLLSGNLDANNQLYIRSDVNDDAMVYVTGTLTNDVQGLVTKASVLSGSCPSFNSDLKTNVAGPAVMYQWQSSADGTTWADISGASSFLYNATVTASAYYRCHITTNNSTYNQHTPARLLTLTGSTYPITGIAQVCEGGTTNLSNATPGGTWSTPSSNISVGATTGIVTGISAGTAVVSYAPATGCAVSTIVTVNQAPSGISGSLLLCTGSGTMLSATPGGGTWDSDNPSVAVMSPSGMAFGASAGTANITYTLSSGCTSVAQVTVNVTPDAISGPGNVCAGSSISLSSATPGGSWSSGSPMVAMVNAMTGEVSGLSVGSSIITYSTGSGCFVTHAVEVNAVPDALTGDAAICSGQTTTLSSAPAGGSWSTSDGGIASVNSLTGLITGVDAGIAIIRYTLASGCSATRYLTVNATPEAITGSASVCTGSTTTLSSSTPGGTWESNTPSVATISMDGTVSPVAAGTATITYTVAGGCYKIRTVTVNTSPAAISGAASVCVGGTSLYTNATGGGMWSTDGSGIASVDASGNVTGDAEGGATVTYSLPTGCYAIKSVTVNGLPDNISGPTSVCAGNIITLTTGSAGGTWSSSAPTTASVDASGNVTGIVAGNATIRYTLPSGCYKTYTVSVNAAPAAISGPSSVCTESSIVLSSTPGGSWYSSMPSVASVSMAAGVVTGNTSGTATISYDISGCAVTKVVSVNSAPGNIVSPTVVCSGSTINLTNPTPGGSWSSNLPSVASVGSNSGLVTGNTAGTATISYTMSNGCYKTTVVDVNAAPAAITGTASMCVGASTTLTSATSGGTWASTNPAVASVNSSTGTVTGSAMGTATISYGILGCYVTKTVSVNEAPEDIVSPTVVCEGSTITLTSATAGGTWSSNAPATASVNTTTGVVTGEAAGTATITYSMGSGCYKTTVVDVNQTPAITGSLAVSPGATTALGATVAGGTWVSSATGVATVNSAGVVSAIVPGTTNITYALPSGCYATVQVTVSNPAIIGSTTVCVGSTVTLSHPVAGGTWSSSNGNATVDAGSGIVTGIGAGTTNITYHMSAGAFQTVVMNVTAAPAAIGGTATVCAGSTTVLTNGGAGTWSSSDPSIASVPATPGAVTGHSAGMATITFQLTSSGCYTTRVVTVNELPSSITGNLSVCLSSTQAFSSTPTGGTWSSSVAGIASVVTATGVVTGNAVGTSILSYTTAAGCRTTSVVSVSSLPAVISGTASICAGANTTLTSTTANQTWSSSNTSVATVATASATTGLVTGVASGTAVISYTNSAGCARTAIVTVNSGLPVIGGSADVCVGGAMTLTNATTGGTWSSSSTATATVTSGGGVVTGVSAGPVTITYRTSVTCFTTKGIIVNSAPSDPITGPTNVCPGATIDLEHAVTGGTWSSSNNTKATIDASTGIVTGVSSGTTTITYYTSAGCYRTYPVTVNAVPAAIGGTLSVVCQASTITLSNSTPGGSWISSNGAIASVGSSTGIITGVAGGNATISYRVTATGCASVRNITVNALPAVISGVTPICAGSTYTFSSSPAGGNWVSSATGAATVGGTTGIVTGVAAGVTNISYTLPTGCRRIMSVTVNARPAAITGGLSMCIGGTTTVNSTTASQTWSSTNTSVATANTLNTTSAAITGIAAGTSTISYTNSLGCASTAIVTVTAAPAAITGADVVCIGGTTTFTHPVNGGTWSSSSTSNATIGASSGVATGVSVGTPNITYRTSATCFVTKVLTVTTAPADPITGPSSVCVGANITLAHAVPSGTWSSSNTLRATVTSGGVVTGASAGTVTISYFTSGGCFRTYLITVLAASLPISGTASACEAGGTTTLSCATSGGTWSSTDASVATVNVSSGLVTGVNAGTAFIIYTLSGSGCAATKVMTVSPRPAVITSGGPICVNATDLYSSATSGGTWSTSAGIIATVAPGGTVTGVAAGTANISYTLSTGCYRTKTVSVNPIPANITGPAEVAELSSVTLATVSTGGTWSSSNTAAATIGATTGIATGVAVGNSTITYQFTATGCYRTRGLITKLFGTRAPGATGESMADVYIYPSPTSRMLTVEAPVNGTFTVFTIDGKEVAKYEVTKPVTAVSLPAGLASGVYMCRYNGEDGSTKVARIVYTP